MSLDLTQLSAKQIATSMYVSYFGRAPEPFGLNWWIDWYNGQLAEGVRHRERVRVDAVGQVRGRQREAHPAGLVERRLRERSAATPAAYGSRPG
jgi:hypothetical protein